MGARTRTVGKGCWKSERHGPKSETRNKKAEVRGPNRCVLASFFRLRGLGPRISTSLVSPRQSVSQTYKYEVEVSAEMLDRNGHVNNVAYIQWMQDAAILHARATGCERITSTLGATWVARVHHIVYLRPVFSGDSIAVLTWVVNFRKVRSLRKYKMVRAGDQALVAEAETDWVFVDARTGRPREIPPQISNSFGF